LDKAYGHKAEGDYPDLLLPNLLLKGEKSATRFDILVCEACYQGKHAECCDADGTAEIDCECNCPRDADFREVATQTKE
jgi:hypothetical protein